MAELTEETVKEIVKTTVRELRKNGLLKRGDDVAYSEISERLFEYYQNPERDSEMAEALERIKSDYYFEIIPKYYSEKYTIDWIAEEFQCEISTVTRNKKRLCLRLFNMLD